MGDVPLFNAIKVTIVWSTSFFSALIASLPPHPILYPEFNCRSKSSFVYRIGPNELSILDPDAIPAIHSSGSKCIKSAWYDVIAGPNPSLQTTRDRATHNRRRKLWEQAFSIKGFATVFDLALLADVSIALREYEYRISELVNELVAQLESLKSQPVNASLWFNFYSFDVMGDLAFGQSFDMMKNQEQHFALKLLQAGMAPLGILTPIPWILVILRKIPGAVNGLKMFTKYIENQAEIRQKNVPTRPDITSWLLKEEKGSKKATERQRRWLYGDTGLMIVAGSDTASAVITHVFYHLAKDPKLVTKLREELKTSLPNDSKFLCAIINETLRLHPPVPSGVLRQTPSAGLMIKNTFIPSGVTISTPTWSLSRLESAFPKANEFLPERWTSAPELLKNKAAFIPFSSVVSRIILHFDVSFGVGETGERLLKDTKDVFTLEVAPLYLNFVKRREVVT
ncbi:Uncharacterized protein BP5553_10536 [Venustampulla echinocandica]|uniref:Cytochrome P450 n=1 Tax=Venustampulla echinocandica TaxID=2656787 RepID=A0A370T8U9_9HELO|nr:Uncharacterized protein BP5553_10536 [Venustampulla echinocandica]RDL29909.1 Uncharacterized protein BP5553_10536 [Venustampulla echinocandica]